MTWIRFDEWPEHPDDEHADITQFGDTTTRTIRVKSVRAQQFRDATDAYIAGRIPFEELTATLDRCLEP